MLEPRRILGQIVDWLEAGTVLSAGCLFVRASRGSGVTTTLRLLAREARLRGFVPVLRSLLSCDGARAPVRLSRLREALAGRPILVLDDWIALSPVSLSAARDGLSRTFLQWTTPLRAVVAVPDGLEGDVWVRLDPLPGDLISRQEGAVMRTPAAIEVREATPSFGTRRADATAVRRLPPDPRTMSLWAEGVRLAERGRHAAADRSLRAACCAFDRRRDTGPAARVRMRLGCLSLDRGHVEQAAELFRRAREQFQEVLETREAVSAAVFLGLALTDAAKLQEAEATLRAACSGSDLLDDPAIRRFARRALARSLYWQGRYGDAALLVKDWAAQATPEKRPPTADTDQQVRGLCLAVRVALGMGELSQAGRLARSASSLVNGSGDPTGLSALHEVQAAVQARLGDVAALHLHVKAGLIAARSEHAPLRALRIRLVLAEGLLDNGEPNAARSALRRLEAVSKRSLPSLLRTRIERALRSSRGDHRSDRSNMGPSAAVSAVLQSAPLQVASLGDVSDVMSLCHAVEDEQEALSRVLTMIRERAESIAAGVFGTADGATMCLARSGALGGQTAERAIALGLAIQPQRTLAGVESAVPVRYSGVTVGAVACRWSVEGPADPGRSMMLMTAAAAAAAPLVRCILDGRPGRGTESTSDSLDLVGTSGGIEEVRRAILRAANAPFAVLVEGESGSGKELVARAIHRAGVRARGKFCPLNCAALSDDLVDAELFGHARGAFTGAIVERAGLFEEADGGTVFLDEVSELAPRAQAKLLRVIQEGEVRRIGENFTRHIDVRLVAATNRSLRAEADAGRFRLDLLYRLDVIRIVVPPLRDRVEDIPLLAVSFWRQATERLSSKTVLGQAVLAALARYDWPGNVRELQNVLAALAVASPRRGVAGAAALPAALAHAARLPAGTRLDEARKLFEQRFVRAALARSAGHRGHAAVALGLSRQGLSKLMQRLQLAPPSSD